MPKGLRGSLYKKDDDFRLSFLYGNYVTLNDLSNEDVDRIIDYHLSPLYVSVHSVNKDIREYLFGRPIPNNILKMLKRLTDGGIKIHAQIVTLPGINDGKVLEESIEKLAEFYPACESVAVVPIGLTKHRKGLPIISGFNKEEAGNLVEWAEKKELTLTGWPKTKKRFFYLSDEFFFLAEKKIPDSSYYGNYPQLSNGVGMSRLFVEEIKDEIRNLNKHRSAVSEFTIVTGKLGYKLITEYIMPLIEANLPKLKIGILSVPNTLFGETVTVSGLLSGRDIIETVRRSENVSSRLVLPPNSINHDGLLIDNFLPSELRDELQKEILIPESNFLEDSILNI
jgi:putative radical SAM enzyme (TIGR03279 family)